MSCGLFLPLADWVLCPSRHRSRFSFRELCACLLQHWLPALPSPLCLVRARSGTGASPTLCWSTEVLGQQSLWMSTWVSMGVEERVGRSWMWWSGSGQRLQKGRRQAPAKLESEVEYALSKHSHKGNRIKKSRPGLKSPKWPTGLAQIRRKALVLWNSKQRGGGLALLLIKNRGCLCWKYEKNGLLGCL